MVFIRFSFFQKWVSRNKLVLEKVRDNETVGDDGYRRIRSDIIFGRLQPGPKIATRSAQRALWRQHQYPA